MAGRPSALYGSVTDERNRGTAVSVEVLPPMGLADKAGYLPETLDPVIQKLIRNADAGAKLLDTYTPMLDVVMNKLQIELQALIGLMPPPSTTIEGEVKTQSISTGVVIMLELAGKVSTIMERITKMTNNAVKSKDDATRLRTFIATGDEEQENMASLGETALRRMVSAAASGWTKPGDEDEPDGS